VEEDDSETNRRGKLGGPAGGYSCPFGEVAVVGPLTETEWDVIKLSPGKTAFTLKKISSYRRGNRKGGGGSFVKKEGAEGRHT